MICFLLLHTEIEGKYLCVVCVCVWGGGGGEGGWGAKGMLAQPPLKLLPPPPTPLQVSQFLSSEIICLLSFFVTG